MKVELKQQWHIPKQQPQTTEAKDAILFGLIHLIAKMFKRASEKTFHHKQTITQYIQCSIEIH